MSGRLLVITQIAERDIGFESHGTPNNVGPGTYSLPVRSEVPKSLSPFSTTKIRDTEELIPKPYTYYTPGPGSYDVPTSQSTKDLTRPVFNSAVARFAPSAPGSSPFLPGDNKDTPAPGTYTTELPQYKESQSHRRIENNSAYRIYRNSDPPAIPDKTKGYGYNVDNNHNLVPRKPKFMNDFYTGVGADKIGPDRYDARYTLTKMSPRYHKMDNDTARGDFYMKGDAPGPGMYDPKHQKTIGNLGYTNETSSFKSNIEKGLCIDKDSSLKPGPGTYTRETEVVTSPVEHSMFVSNSTRLIPLQRDINTPYCNPTNLTTPGPGAYQESREAFSDHSTRLTLNDKIPFLSTEDRGVCNRIEKNADLGPGSYDYINGTVVGNNEEKMRSGRHDVFGHSLVPKDFQLRGMETPGPGAYGAQSGLGDRKDCSSSIFLSEVDRSMEVSNNPHIYKLPQPPVPGVGQYNISGDFKPKSNIYFECGFNSTRPRNANDEIFGEKINKVPPVGAYNIKCQCRCSRLKSNSTTFLTADRRFKPGLNSYKNIYTPAELGPGSYDLGRDFGKRSYNVIYLNKKDNPHLLRVRRCRYRDGDY